MASGRKELFINNLERAVSTDINRMQKFASADLAELLRYMLNTASNEDQWALASSAGTTLLNEPAPGSAASPLVAEILNGFLVRPQAGSLNLLVDPGVMMTLAPDAAADDSPYKYVRDPGVSTPGALAFTTNGGGSPRIDVVEMQVSNVISETDNRDIFNPVTGLFSATTVTKATVDTCTFVGGATNIRVRAGVVGSGFPGTASGWLPICVIYVPAGAVNADTCHFWDVRPLITDREFGMSPVGRIEAQIKRYRMRACANTPGATTDYRLIGLVDAVATQNGISRRLGGLLQRGTPGTTASAQVDLGSSDSWDPGIANLSSGTTMYFAYLLTPFGLPRWARYTDGPSGRVPRNPKGIPVLTTIAPKSDGSPSAAITLPTSTGLVGTTTSGVCILASLGGGANTLASSFIGSGGGEMFGGDPTGGLGCGFTSLSASSSSITSAKYSIVDGTTNGKVPACARRLLVQAQVILNNPTGAPITVGYNPDCITVDLAGTPPSTSGKVIFESNIGSNQFATVPSGGGAFTMSSIPIWIPVPMTSPIPIAGGVQFEIQHHYALTNSAGLTIASPVLYIHGYDLVG